MVGKLTYEFRIRGRMSDLSAAAFSGFRTDICEVETALVGELRDQAELYGVLSRIQQLGLELLAVRQLPGGTEHKS